MTRWATGVLVFCLVCLYSAHSHAEPIVIAAIGDSNIAGKGVAMDDAYPAKLQKALRAKGYDVRVSNAGRIGDTTQGLMRRLDDDVPTEAKMAIVWIGINDLRAGMPQAQVEADRQEIAGRLEKRGVRVVLLGPGTGLAEQRQYQIGDRQGHLNARGYDLIVERTLGDVEAVLKPMIR
jgi:acyl-CoA thioesterase I